ncbi:hypothetical protein ACQ4LE_003215 [Meloidogyne hapla]|uniref:DFDF domain-containing protein n=2 Tax=Meloidogyne hapla TaxID=6305 RepID=A0A1I8B153_MELHA
MSSNNQNNSNRREKENKNFNNQKDSTPIIYEPELMDAEDSLLEIRSSFGKAEKNGNMTEKLVDTDFYKDFGDLFDPDVKVKN